jgi:hypothetical protein
MASRFATCSPDVGSTPHLVVLTAVEYGLVPPPTPGFDACVPILRDGFESGDTGAWSGVS